LHNTAYEFWFLIFGIAHSNSTHLHPILEHGYGEVALLVHILLVNLGSYSYNYSLKIYWFTLYFGIWAGPVTIGEEVSVEEEYPSLPGLILYYHSAILLMNFRSYSCKLLAQNPLIHILIWNLGMSMYIYACEVWQQSRKKWGWKMRNNHQTSIEYYVLSTK